MHPLVIYAAVREEHARRSRQARLERAARGDDREAGAIRADTGRLLGRVARRLNADLGHRLGAVVRRRTGAT